MVDAPDALRSSIADRYRIEREIGAGGMATVYLARDLRHDRAVALKVLRPDLAAAMGVERFQREVTLTAALQHPHILPLFDSGESAGWLYYVTPYVDGESLREKLEREGQLKIDDALRITRQVADALDYAHRNGVVHRDIKPANILLAAYGSDGRTHALVADFGIARALPNAANSARGLRGSGINDRLTQTGLALGTPTYMSPEQTMGDARVDGRSDVYSLACVVYEVLAGEPPFTGATGEILVARKLSASIPSVAQIRPSVPSSVDAVISRGLVPVAADRYATAAEFATALVRAFATRADFPRGIRLRRVARSIVALAVIGAAAWAFAAYRTRRVDTLGLRGTRDSVAHALRRQAHDEIDRRTEASIGHGVTLLKRAIGRDSNYVDAWADLTRALVFAENNRYAVPGIAPANLVESAVNAGQRALEADSMSASAWIARGTTLYLIEPTTRRGVIRALHRARFQLGGCLALLGDLFPGRPRGRQRADCVPTRHRHPANESADPRLPCAPLHVAASTRHSARLGRQCRAKQSNKRLGASDARSRVDPAEPRSGRRGRFHRPGRPRAGAGARMGVDGAGSHRLATSRRARGGLVAPSCDR
jgi:hypothetical protein